MLGVDPQLVLILELNGPIDNDDIDRRGLQVLEATDERAMVAFASDPELTKFLNDLERYAAGPPEGRQRPPLQNVFDAISDVRVIRPHDVLDSDLRARLDTCSGKQQQRIDIECWCPEVVADARERFAQMEMLVAQIGAILDRSCIPEVGFSVIRADVRSDLIWQLADTTRVRRISRLPRPELTRVEIRRAGVTALPAIETPARHAPLLAVVDTGVRAEHALLRQAVVAQHSVGALDAMTDENGHGTMVAGLALYGSFEKNLHGGTCVRPAGRIVSIRVLDHDCHFPDDRIWQNDIAKALEVAARLGARVVNLSLGDDRHPYRPPGPVPVAALVDGLARLHNMVVVISSGNLSPDGLPRSADIVNDYPRWLLDLNDQDDHDLVPKAEAGLAPPAMAALALTVGATVPEREQGARSPRFVVDQTPMGKPGQVSPFSRVGPGIERAVKPELVAPGGSFCFDRGQSRVFAVPDTCVLGPGGTEPDQLLSYAVGTSFAAPLVAHAALRVLGRYPRLSANAVRALLLASALPAPEVLAGGSKAELAAAHRRLTGFGAVNAERAEFSSDHRAVLLADGQIKVDDVHFYVVSIPRAFFEVARKWIRVALTHDPPVRATRLRYLANRMSVCAYRGVNVDEVRRRYAAHNGTDGDDLPQFPKSKTINLMPSDRDLCRGANQLGVCSYHNRWQEEFRDGEIVVAVRCVGRWGVGEPIQRYALAVVLETDGSGAPLYAELSAHMTTVAEIEPEIELG